MTEVRAGAHLTHACRDCARNVLQHATAFFANALWTARRSCSKVCTVTWRVHFCCKQVRRRTRRTGAEPPAALCMSDHAYREGARHSRRARRQEYVPARHRAHLALHVRDRSRGARTPTSASCAETAPAEARPDPPCLLRQLLLSAWIAKQRNDTSPTRTLQSIRKGVDRLDRVLSASGAHTAALQISVKPAEPSEALNLIHDQVLRRVKECVDSG